MELVEAERWFYDQIDVIDDAAFDTLDRLGPDGLIRRWEAALALSETAGDGSPSEAALRPGPIRVLEPGRFDPGGLGSADPFPTTGGEAFRALGGREWAATLPADDDTPTPGLLIVVAFLAGVSGLAIGMGLGIAFAELARQVLS